MKIYLTNLGRYNEGYLVGKWVKLPVCEEVLDKVLEYEACRSVSDVLELLDKLDEFDLLTDVTDDEELGYYYAEEYCNIDIPENIQPYFNYEAYGRDIRLESSCLYTSYGFLLDNR